MIQHTYVKTVVFLKRRDVIAANLTLVHSKLHTMYVATHDVTNQSHTMSMLDLPRVLRDTDVSPISVIWCLETHNEIALHHRKVLITQKLISRSRVRDDVVLISFWRHEIEKDDDFKKPVRPRDDDFKITIKHKMLGGSTMKSIPGWSMYLVYLIFAHCGWT